MQRHSFASALAPFHLLNHPFYQDWMAGNLSQGHLQDYACQYAAHVDAFPRYLGAIHSFCEDAAQRKIVLENLNDEEGVTYGTSHPDLWRQFAAGMGVTEEQIESGQKRDAIRNVINTFFKFARSSFHEGLGALYAYEYQVPEIAGSKIDGLQKNYGVSDDKTLQFFEVHKTADVYHRSAIEKIIDQFSAEERVQALNAAKAAGQALWDFLTDVHQQNRCLSSGACRSMAAN